MEKLRWPINGIRSLPLSTYYTIVEYYANEAKNKKIPDDIAEKQAQELERIHELKRIWQTRKELTNLTG